MALPGAGIFKFVVGLLKGDAEWQIGKDLFNKGKRALDDPNYRRELVDEAKAEIEKAKTVGGREYAKQLANKGIDLGANLIEYEVNAARGLVGKEDIKLGYGPDGAPSSTDASQAPTNNAPKAPEPTVSETSAHASTKSGLAAAGIKLSGYQSTHYNGVKTLSLASEQVVDTDALGKLLGIDPAKIKHDAPKVSNTGKHEYHMLQSDLKNPKALDLVSANIGGHDLSTQPLSPSSPNFKSSLKTHLKGEGLSVSKVVITKTGDLTLHTKQPLSTEALGKALGVDPSKIATTSLAGSNECMYHVKTAELNIAPPATAQATGQNTPKTDASKTSEPTKSADTNQGTDQNAKTQDQSQQTQPQKPIDPRLQRRINNFYVKDGEAPKSLPVKHLDIVKHSGDYVEFNAKDPRVDKIIQYQVEHSPDKRAPTSSLHVNGKSYIKLSDLSQEALKFIEGESSLIYSGSQLSPKNILRGLNKTMSLSKIQIDEGELYIASKRPLDARGMENLRKAFGVAEGQHFEVQPWGETKSGGHAYKIEFEGMDAKLRELHHAGEAKGLVRRLVGGAAKAPFKLTLGALGLSGFYHDMDDLGHTMKQWFTARGRADFVDAMEEQATKGNPRLNAGIGNAVYFTRVGGELLMSGKSLMHGEFSDSGEHFMNATKQGAMAGAFKAGTWVIERWSVTRALFSATAGDVTAVVSNGWNKLFGEAAKGGLKQLGKQGAEKALQAGGEAAGEAVAQAGARFIAKQGLKTVIEGIAEAPLIGGFITAAFDKREFNEAERMHNLGQITDEQFDNQARAHGVEIGTAFFFGSGIGMLARGVYEKHIQNSAPTEIAPIQGAVIEGVKLIGLVGGYDTGVKGGDVHLIEGGAAYTLPTKAPTLRPTR